MHVRSNRRTGSWLRGVLAASVVAAFTVSCGSSTDLTDHSEAGSYGLLTVNGQPFPVTMTSTSLGTVVVESGTLSLTASGFPSYTATISGSVNGGDSSPFLSDAGRYDRSGSALTFHSTAAPFSYSGTYDHNTGAISVTLPGAVLGVSGNVVLGLAPLLQ